MVRVEVSLVTVTRTTDWKVCVVGERRKAARLEGVTLYCVVFRLSRNAH